LDQSRRARGGLLPDFSVAAVAESNAERRLKEGATSAFAQALARGNSVFVNDAFGSGGFVVLTI